MKNPRSIPVLPLATALLAAFSHAGQIVVPDDQPTLQSAIDVASPYDVIIVRTSVDQVRVTVDKPLTIIGDPIVNLRVPFGFSCQAPSLRLAGPAHGTLVLANLNVSSGEDCTNPPAGIAGGGFDELQIYNSSIRPPRAGIQGTGGGSPGIDTSIPLVFLSSCFVKGQNPDADVWVSSVPTAREPGLLAPTSTVVLLDCTIQGGDGPITLGCEFCNCPPSLNGLGGAGGDAVVCDQLFHAGSTLLGGTGATFFAWPTGAGLPPPQHCGKQPDGHAYSANGVVALPQDLTSSGPIRLGMPWTLSWNTTGPIAVLFVAPGPAVPTLYPRIGWGFAAAPTVIPLGTFAAGGPRSLTINFPVNPAFLGLELVFQMVDASDGLTRPVFGLIQP